jgi:transposase
VATETIEPTEQSSLLRELRWRVSHYQSLHARAVARENILKQKLEALRQLTGQQKERLDALLLENEKFRSRLTWLEQQIFGRKTEQLEHVESKGESAGGTAEVAAAGKKRGQQPGTNGHGRKRQSGLATVEIPLDLPEDKRCCPKCGKHFRQVPWTEDSEEIHWEVRLFRRVYRRARYLPACECDVLPGIVAAPLPPKLIPKGMFSTGFWVRLLMQKFLFQQPLCRVRQALALEGLAVSQGTLTGGLKRIGSLVEPLYAMIVERNRAAEHWHMDETRWQVFAELEGKVGHRWWLWVAVTADTCVYILDPFRSAAVPQAHLEGKTSGIVSADRYSAYKALDKIKIAFCWSHVRRDFLRVRDGYRPLRRWGQGWVARIDELFKLNARRLEFSSMPDAFAAEQRALRETMAAMASARDRELADASLHPAARKALKSLRYHWKGLMIFVDQPEIPMDNNEAERRLRNPVIGRKNYYGSGSIWSGTLSAALFTIFQTLLINKLDPQKFLLSYFQACALAGGCPPKDLSAWLPWNLTEEQKSSWRYPAKPP